MKLIKGTSVLLLSAAISVGLAGCGGAQERKAEYLAQAKTSFEAKDYDKAKLGYKNAIQIDPISADARVGLAQVAWAQGEFRAAVAHYRSALEINENHIEGGLGLAKAYLIGGAVDEANAHIAKVLSLDPQNVGARTIKAALMARDGDADGALQLAKAVFDENPKDGENAALYASLLAKSGKFEQAAATVKASLALQPDNLALYSALVNVYKMQGDHEQAIATLQQVVDMEPEAFRHKKRKVAYIAEMGDLPRATQTLQGFVDQDPEDVDARQALVDLVLSQQRFADAEELLVKYMAEFPDEHGFRLGLARVKLQQQDQGAALDVLAKLIADAPPSPVLVSANMLRAQIYLSQQQEDLAKAELESILTEHADHAQALMMRGTLALKERRVVDALNDFRSVLKNDPNDPLVLRALADAHFQAGDYRLSENYYKKLLAVYPEDLGLKDALARLYAATNKTEDALRLRDEIASAEPDDVANLIDLAKLRLAARDYPGLERLAAKLSAQAQTKASGLYFDGIAKQGQGQHQAAIGLFEQALAITPGAVEPISGKVKSLIALKRAPEAQQWLKAMHAESGGTAYSHNLLGEVAMVSAQHEQALQGFAKAIELNPKWDIPYGNQARTYNNQDKPEQAIAALKAGVAAANKPDSLRLELAGVMVAREDYDGAIEQYQALYQSSDKAAVIANNLAMLLVTYKTDEASYKQALEVASALRGETNPLFMDTLGWVYFRNKQPDLALPLVREAAQKAPQIAQINYHLAEIYLAKENAEQARKHLELATESPQEYDGKAEAQALLNKLNEAG